MIYLSLDPNTECTGWCLYNTDTKAKESGVLLSPKGTKKNEICHNDRMRQQRDQLAYAIDVFRRKDIYSKLKGYVDYTIIEDVYYNPKFGPLSPIQISRFSMFIITDQTIDWEFVTWSEWKSSVGIKSRSKDDNYIQKCFEIANNFMGKNCTTLDEAESICIMIYYLNKYKLEK